MVDIEIDFARLNQFAGTLKQVAVELDDAEVRAESLHEVLNLPFPDESRLADEAKDTADSWEYRRGVLVADVVQLALKTDEVGKVWNEWDTSAGSSPQTELEPGTFPGSC